MTIDDLKTAALGVALVLVGAIGLELAYFSFRFWFGG